MHFDFHAFCTDIISMGGQIAKVIQIARFLTPF